MTTSKDEVSSVAAGTWKIRAERALGEQAATGEAVVRADGATHAALAGARAWHTLSQERLAAGDLEDAISAARAGLAELGSRYYARSLGVIDDTAQQISKAEHQITSGAVENAAARLNRALEDRITLYARLYGEELAE